MLKGRSLYILSAFICLIKCNKTDEYRSCLLGWQIVKLALHSFNDLY